MRNYNPDTNKVEYDELNTFFVLIHIMKKLGYRRIYDSNLSKTNEHLTLIEENLQSGFPNLYEHLLEEIEVSLAPYFTNIIMTIFVANLQDSNPLVAAHIFDVFLIDGEKVIFTLIMKFIFLKQQKLMTLYENDLMEYMKDGLTNECFNENSMLKLLDYEDLCCSVIEQTERKTEKIKPKNKKK